MAKKSRNRRVKVGPNKPNATVIQSVVHVEYIGDRPPKIRGRYPEQFVKASSQESAASLRKRPARQKRSSLLTDEEAN